MPNKLEEIEVEVLKQVKWSVGDILLRSDKIIMFKPFEHVTTCTLVDLKEMYFIFMDLTKGVPHLFYSDNSNIKSFGAEDRAYISETFHHFAIASAIKENSAVVRFITHSIIYLNKPKIALKMFKTENDAMNWLKSL